MFHPRFKRKRLPFALLRFATVLLLNSEYIAILRKPRRKHRSKSSKTR